MNELTKFVGKKEITEAKQKALRKFSENLGVNCSVGRVFLAIDCSGSMDNGKLRQVKNGAMEFASDAIAKGYAVGLIKFDNNAELLCEPVNEISFLREYIQNLRTNGATYMSKGINLAHKYLKGDGSLVIVIATDGMPMGVNETVEKVLAVAAKAKQEGIDIITIGTEDADKNFLSKLASRTELVNYVPSFQFGKAIASAVKMLPAS